MLDSKSPLLAHRLQNAALLALSLFFLPIDTFSLFLSFIHGLVLQSQTQSRRIAYRRQPGFRPRTVLVTGVGMTKGLFLARLFYEAGHNVVGADFEPDGALAAGRFSNALVRFYRLQKPSTRSGSAPYIQCLLDIITKNGVDLWVSCSGVASAVEDGEAKEIVEARTQCKAIQFDIKTTQTLHEKDTFIEQTAQIGLTVPETHAITSRAAVENILQNCPAKRKYIMKTVGMNDAVRADMTLLPRPNQMETSKHIARLNISEKSPWILQQFIRGSEYCTHSLIIKGQVEAFVACPSAELLMHYEALASQSALSQAMLKFTRQYAHNGGENFTGHLSFDFLVEDDSPSNPNKIVLYPIECNPRAHTAVAHFNGTCAMIDRYLSLLDEKPSSLNHLQLVQPLRNDKFYWIGHDLVTKVILPSMSLMTFNTSLSEVLYSYKTFIVHVLTWKDGTYELWDPLPWWWLYHVYWPMRFFHCLSTGKKWSRMNVSTTKMFEC